MLRLETVNEIKNEEPLIYVFDIYTKTYKFFSKTILKYKQVRIAYELDINKKQKNKRRYKNYCDIINYGQWLECFIRHYNMLVLCSSLWWQIKYGSKRGHREDSRKSSLLYSLVLEKGS